MIAYRDTWPETPRLLWRLRHKPFTSPQGFTQQRVCVTCSGMFTAGHFRDHLRSVAHRENRGWWR